MDTKKLGVLEFLDKYEVEFGDEYVFTCLDEYVLTCLNNNDKDDFDVYFIHEHPLAYLLEKTLGGQYLFHHGYMQNIGWCDTYVHFFYHHNYKNHMIYHDHLNGGRDKVWSETKIHFSQHHQHFF